MDIEAIKKQIVLYNPKMFPIEARNRRKRRAIKLLTMICVMCIMLVIGFVLVNMFSPKTSRTVSSIIGYAQGQVDILTEKTEQGTKKELETIEQSDGFIMPTQGRISSGFGERDDPFTGEYDFHKGLDIAAEEGTKIYAAASGEVIATGTQDLAGNYVIIRHADGIKTKYFHCLKVLVNTGDRVTTKTPIALVGSTGNSTGPHLHFEVYINDEVVNPMVVLDD